MVGAGISLWRVLARFCGGAGIFGLAGYARGVKEQGKITAPVRAAGGRFAPGSSGNPRGRPAGRRDARTVILGELLDGDGAAIVGQLVEQAKQGVPWAVRLCIERLLPRHERRVDVDLPRVETAADVGAAVASVIDLAAGGDLTIDEARAFLALLDQQRRAIETHDLAVRLELLEAEKKQWD